MKNTIKTLKIVNINGSPHASIGNTQKLVNMLISGLQAREIKTDVVNHYIIKENIEECRGCIRCMRKGECILKDKDDIHKIIDNLLNSDLVIFSSPIYVLNVTGYMKKFIDRVAYMTHRLVMEGKLGVSVVSSQGLGVDSVLSYLNNIMEAMGMYIVGSISGWGFFHNRFENITEIEESISNIAEKLLSIDLNDINSKISKNEMKRRERFKSLMKLEEISKLLFYEDYKYWNSKEDEKVDIK